MGQPAAFAVAAVATILALPGCSCEEGGGGTSRDVAWTIRFDDPVHAREAVRIEYQVFAGATCTGAPIDGDSITRTDTGVMPDVTLTPGPHCFTATAIDRGCVRFATGSITTEIPGGAPIELVLSVVDVERLCVEAACREGECVPIDAGPPDAGPPDSGFHFDGGPDGGPIDVIPDRLPGCRPVASALFAGDLVSAGGAHTCALRAGSALCWGSDEQGQLGTGELRGESRVPATVAGGHTFVSISAGGSHTCGIDDAQSIWCWGDDARGQLGRGGTDRSPAPEPVLVGSGYTVVAAGRAHTCALTTGMDPSIVCWGANDLGQLGLADAGDQPSPGAPVITRAGALAAGQDHSCAVRFPLPKGSPTEAVCWGAEGPWLGRLAPMRDPLVVIDSAEAFQSFALGATQSCAFARDAASFETILSCWGAGDLGQLLDGTTTTSAIPVGSRRFGFFASCAAGDGFSCYEGIEPAMPGVFGPLSCAGDGSTGALGPGVATSFTTPVTVLRDAFNVEAGAHHVCAQSPRGLLCWGQNDRGQLGTGVAASIDPQPRYVCF